MPSFSIKYSDYNIWTLVNGQAFVDAFPEQNLFVNASLVQRCIMIAMKVSGIIWLQKIIDKLDWKHHLIPEEVEEAFINKPQYRLLERGKIEGEDVYAAYSRTDSGRYITIIFIRKAGGKALVISARDMDRKERKQYG